VFASGFLIIALEIVWFRLLGVMMQGNAYAFSLVLAVFLLGDALGIVAGVAIVRHLPDLRRAFLLLQGGMAACALLSAVALHAAHGTFGGFVGWTDGYFASLPALFAVIGLTLAVVLPPAFLLGMSFPIAQAAVQDDPGLVGQRVGVIQLANILGNAAGALVAGLLLLHWFGTVGTLRLVGVAGALLLVPILLQARGSGRVPRVELALAATVALLLVALPTNDRFWARLHGAADGDAAFVGEDRTGVAVFRREEQDWGLYIGGYRQSHAPFHSYQVSLGLVGVTLHPDPKSVLIIGQGTGGTPYGGGANPRTERIRVVEIVGPVYEVARQLARHSGDPGLNLYLADPRFERVVGDGRHALSSDPRTYDVIEADAIYPHGSRAGMLYSVEHFRLILSRLNPGGLYLQWRASPNTERTFRAAFPHVVVLSNNMLLGSNRPIAVDVEAFRDKVFGPVRPYLERIGVDPELTMLDLGQPIRVEKPGDERPSARLNTDLFPRDEYYLNTPLSF
jgi:predicted membrane-bound spermidine synthase